jgi:DNA repair photolyase
MSSRVQIHSIEARSILTKTSGALSAFDYSLQPYAGCEFSCAYCYVREMAVQRFNRSGRAWSTWLEPKTNAPELLARAIDRGKVKGARIFMSSATDPYTPSERTHRITRRILEAFVSARARGLGPSHLVVQTRSPFVVRDVDLLSRLGRTVIVHVSMTTDREEVRRAFEPNSASVERRLATLGTLKAAGIPVRATVAPLLPSDPLRFARLLDRVSDEVILDNFFDGDGAGGSRSRPSFLIHEREGWGAWCEPGYDRAARAIFESVLGKARVLFSIEGFGARIPEAEGGGRGTDVHADEG